MNKTTDDNQNLVNQYPPGKRLRIRYLVGLGTVALFILLAQIKVQYSIMQQSQDSRVVNIAGRQRMLSQRLAKVVLAIQQTESERAQSQYVAEMREAISLFELSHNGLRHGSSKLDIPPTLEKSILEKYTAIEPHFEAILGAAKRFVDASVDKEPIVFDSELLGQVAGEILGHEGPFLVGMDSIVFAHDSSARLKVTRLKYTEVVLLILALTVLVAVGFLVFEPSVRIIRDQFTEISRVAALRRQLIEELESAFATVKQLHGLLPICASCKNIRNDEGYWTQLEIYVEEHSDAQFTHSVCPDCLERIYPEFKS